MSARGLRVLLLAYGACNAALYAVLLPLWDGFDEPFHYSYVEQLARRRELPVMGRATLTAEVRDSLALAPGSYLVKRNLPGVMAFDEYFALPASGREELRGRLERLDPRAGGETSDAPNYEAHQPPLAYAILAPLDFICRGAPLLTRVLVLRLFCGIFAAIAMGLLTLRLADRLGLDERWAASAAFVVLSGQMLYATTAHIANDWLAVPLFAALVLAAIELRRDRRARTAAAFAAILAAGLLTKAYFLAALPFAAYELLRARRAAAIAPLLAAIPWYARNVALYHDLSGMQETAGRGIPFTAMLHDLARFPWARSAYATATHALWSGNNSDTTFHAPVIALLIALLAAGGILALRRRTPARNVVLIAAASYAVGLLYSTILSHTVTGGVQISPSPWYAQPIIAPLVCLATAGLGNALRRALVALSAYIIAATWLAKLIPLYAGFAGRASLANLWRWYAGSSHGVLSLTAMAPAPVIWTLVAISVAGALSLAVVLYLDRKPI